VHHSTGFEGKDVNSNTGLEEDMFAEGLGYHQWVEDLKIGPEHLEWLKGGQSTE
jgi:hypothetical protein